MGSTRVVFNGSDTPERSDYYPSGMRWESPYIQAAQNRYLYNGKESQESVGLTGRLDYGARNYNPRIMLWDGVDKLAEKYPALSPYSYCLNNPINAFDPDGKLVIFVNGFVPELWAQHSNRLPQGYYGGYGIAAPQSYSPDRTFHPNDFMGYWGKIEKHYTDHYNDENNLFINASYTPRSTANLRYEEGMQAGSNLIEMLQSGQMTLSHNETIKIIGHSQGAAFAAGIATVLASHGQYADLLEFVHYISPHQPKNIKHPAGVKGIQFSTMTDMVSSRGLARLGNSTFELIPGAEWGIERDSYSGGFGGHSVDTWLYDLINFCLSNDIPITVRE